TTACTFENACLACAARSVLPTSCFCESHAVWPDTYSVLLPLATTAWEKPWSRLRKTDGGLTDSFIAGATPRLLARSEIGPSIRSRRRRAWRRSEDRRRP